MILVNQIGLSLSILGFPVHLHIQVLIDGNQSQGYR